MKAEDTEPENKDENLDNKARKEPSENEGSIKLRGE